MEEESRGNGILALINVYNGNSHKKQTMEVDGLPAHLTPLNRPFVDELLPAFE
jgi:hypothetical protein